MTVTQEYFRMKWKIEKSSPKSEAPRARSGHRIVYYNGQIYTFGGYNPESEALDEHLFKELWKFNLITKEWKKIAITGMSLRVFKNYNTLVYLINVQHVLLFFENFWPDQYFQITLYFILIHELTSI